MIVLCVWLGPRPDRRRDRDHPGLRGSTSVLFNAEFAEAAPRLERRRRSRSRGSSDIPVLGAEESRTAVSSASPSSSTSASCSSSLVAWIFRRTNIGLNLRAAGEKPEALDAAGVSVVATRSLGRSSTGALAGLGGAYLSIVGAGIFQPVHHPGPGLHGDRDRDAGARPSALGRGRLVPVRDRALARRLLPARRHQHLDGRHLHASRSSLILAVLILFGRRSYLPAALALPYVRGAR